MNNPKNALVLFDNRQENEIALKLLIESILSYCEPIDIHLFAPNASSKFVDWAMSKFAFRVTLHKTTPGELQGWNVKPNILIWALDHGYGRAIFMDSDIILSRKWPDKLTDSHQTKVVLAQLTRSDRVPTQAFVKPWGLETGRSFVRGITACVMSVGRQHRPLLEDWRNMLASTAYQASQDLPHSERPVYSRGSDAILTSLLGSKKYKNLDIDFIKSSSEIAQCLILSHFTLDARLMTLFRKPPAFIHAMGPKPWLTHSKEEFTKRCQVSPYNSAARKLLSKQEQHKLEWLSIPPPLKRRFSITKDSIAFFSFPEALIEFFQLIGIRTPLRIISFYIKTWLNKP